jgi:hypothetical protein
MAREDTARDVGSRIAGFTAHHRVRTSWAFNTLEFQVYAYDVPQFSDAPGKVWRRGKAVAVHDRKDLRSWSLVGHRMLPSLPSSKCHKRSPNFRDRL